MYLPYRICTFTQHLLVFFSSLCGAAARGRTGALIDYRIQKVRGEGGSERPQMQNAQIPTEYFFTEICP